jgi:hypothetical protein
MELAVLTTNWHCFCNLEGHDGDETFKFKTDETFKFKTDEKQMIQRAD